MEKTETKTEQLIQMEAVVFTNQYYDLFKKQLKSGMSFENHLLDIQFNREVYEFIENHFMVIIKEYDLDGIKFDETYENPNELAMKKEIEKKLMKEIKKNYLDRIKEELNKEMIRWEYAKEDEVFFKERMYLNEPIGFEDMNEKEREKEIKNAKKKQDEQEEKIKKLETLKMTLM